MVSAAAGVLRTADPLRLAPARTVRGQGTKSLRDSPLRGGKSREAVASREESDSESTRSTAINKPTVATFNARSSASS